MNQIPPQSGCDSFQESREDLISHLALFHNQLDDKMEAKKKNINVSKLWLHSCMFCSMTLKFLFRHFTPHATIRARQKT